MNLANLPVPGKARFTAVVTALLKRTTEQLDHPRPLKGDVGLFPFLLQVKTSVRDNSQHTLNSC